MKVRHFGNTANNAYYNARVLEEYAGIESELPIAMFGLEHGMSAPAWEAVDFDVPDAAWPPQPSWEAVPEAVEVNAEYSDLLPTVEADETAPLPSDYRFRGFLPGTRRRLNSWVAGARWAQPLVDFRTRQRLARRAILPEPDGRINVLYGAASLDSVRVPDSASRSVTFEHGTIRWVGSDEESPMRRAYREQVQQSQHLWVTNLDPRTLEIAEELMPGRWSALPHPFVPDPRVPFRGSEAKRQKLLQRTRSEALVLLPSSQNWSEDHDKGSITALNAFIELRRSGASVGLVAVEWGLQLAESKALLESAGVGTHVAWVPPMVRLSLQRMMANVDVVWDQFGLEAFGALAIRTVEQGTPLISRKLAPIGEQLIGGPVPWLHAATVDEIVQQTTVVLDDMGHRGRDAVIADYRARYRAWLLERHSPELTATLQREVYEKIVDGTLEPGSAVPDRWSQILDEWSRDGS